MIAADEYDDMWGEAAVAEELMAEVVAVDKSAVPEIGVCVCVCVLVWIYGSMSGVTVCMREQIRMWLRP